MAFIDLEAGFPPEKGTYRVNIQTNTGTREVKAVWNAPGFTLIDTVLGADEYIFEWFEG